MVNREPPLRYEEIYEKLLAGLKKGELIVYYEGPCIPEQPLKVTTPEDLIFSDILRLITAGISNGTLIATQKKLRRDSAKDDTHRYEYRVQGTGKPPKWPVITNATKTGHRVTRPRNPTIQNKK